MQRKEEPDGEKEVAKGDEDGPASSEGTVDLEDAPPDDALTEDEDPLSDADESRNAVDGQQPRSEVVRKSILQWRDVANRGLHKLTPEGSHASSTPCGLGHHCTGCRRSWRAGDPNMPFRGICDRCNLELQDGILQARSALPIHLAIVLAPI